MSRRRLHDLVITVRSRPARFVGWAVAAILALAAATAYGVALWKAPGWVHASKPQDRYNARVLVISVGGALVVGAGLLYTARNYRLSRRGQVTDRFSVALERFGSTDLYVRIGGVVALGRVMRESPYLHDDVMQVLSAFIRDRVPRLADQSSSQAWMHPVTGSDLPTEPTPDVQAAITALAYRPLRPELRVVNLTRVYLRHAFLEGANLTGARLDAADLTYASLTGADLTGARLDGANLAYASLAGVNLTHASLAYARLDCADLTGAYLDGAVLAGASLAGANLASARLEGANLTGALLVGALLARARLHGADLTGAAFDRAVLTGALLGADQPVVPPGWTVTDPKTGELGPWPAGPGRPDG
jgi:uncharacterized protein YjbI with pentapeptide repeats